MIAELLLKAGKDCLLRRLFVLSSVEVGLGPLATQVGDCLSILHGSPTPVMLRCFEDQSSLSHRDARSEAHGRYLVAGQAYVEGMMLGGIISECENDGPKPQIL